MTKRRNASRNLQSPQTNKRSQSAQNEVILSWHAVFPLGPNLSFQPFLHHSSPYRRSHQLPPHCRIHPFPDTLLLCPGPAKWPLHGMTAHSSRLITSPEPLNLLLIYPQLESRNRSLVPSLACQQSLCCSCSQGNALWVETSSLHLHSHCLTGL